MICFGGDPPLKTFNNFLLLYLLVVMFGSLVFGFAYS